MDFEEWIRGQLHPDGAGSAGTPRPLRARRSWPRFATVAVQALAGVAAIAIVVGGLTSTESRPAFQIRLLMPSGPSLPADTWAGRPPLPAGEVATVESAAQVTSAAPLPVAEAAPVPLFSPPAAQRPGATATVAPALQTRPTPEPEHEDSQPPPTPAVASAPPSPRSTSTFTLKGGTVTASCTSGRISVDSITTNPGFQSEVEVHDGGRTIDVRLRSSFSESELQVWCSAGLVQSQVR